MYECKGVTDAGLPFLAALPRLREVALDSLPGVTLRRHEGVSGGRAGAVLDMRGRLASSLSPGV